MSSRILLVLVVLALLAACGEGPPSRPRPSAVRPIALADVLAAVRAAPAVRSVPAGLSPPLPVAGDDIGFDNVHCEAAPTAGRVDKPCVAGDRASDVRVVLWGDSHAGMWLPALTEIALRRHWRVELYGKPACPAAELTFWNQQEGRPFTECAQFRAFVLGRVRAERPALVMIANQSFARKDGRGDPVTPEQWRGGLTGTLTAVSRWADRVVVLGDTPVLDESAPECLAAHVADVATCFTTRAEATTRVWNDADIAAAKAADAGYISVLPWLCTAICTPVIGGVVVYRNRFHLTGTYARRLNGVLEDALVRVADKPDIA